MQPYLKQPPAAGITAFVSSAGHKLLSTEFYSIIIRGLVSLLMIGLCLWVLFGIGHILVNLYHAGLDQWGDAAGRTIVNILTLLAMLEIFRTLQSYLEIGRVRVTFILDAALVVLIGELISIWFKNNTPQELLLNLGVIAALIMLRIVTARMSPQISGKGGLQEF